MDLPEFKGSNQDTLGQLINSTNEMRSREEEVKSVTHPNQLKATLNKNSTTFHQPKITYPQPQSQLHQPRPQKQSRPEEMEVEESEPASFGSYSGSRASSGLNRPEVGRGNKSGQNGSKGWW